MRITERKLRSIIRSVIREGANEDKFWANYEKTRSRRGMRMDQYAERLQYELEESGYADAVDYEDLAEISYEIANYAAARADLNLNPNVTGQNAQSAESAARRSRESLSSNAVLNSNMELKSYVENMLSGHDRSPMDYDIFDS